MDDFFFLFWHYLDISNFFVNVRMANTPLPLTFASVHIWLTPPPPLSANVIYERPLMMNAVVLHAI